MSDEQQRTFKVTGMSCEHCATAVKAEVGRVAGVSNVDVDLAGGVLAVRGGAIDTEAVRIAVEEAGYSLAAGAA